MTCDEVCACDGVCACGDVCARDDAPVLLLDDVRVGLAFQRARVVVTCVRVMTCARVMTHTGTARRRVFGGNT